MVRREEGGRRWRVPPRTMEEEERDPPRTMEEEERDPPRTMEEERERKKMNRTLKISLPHFALALALRIVICIDEVMNKIM